MLDVREEQARRLRAEHALQQEVAARDAVRAEAAAAALRAAQAEARLAEREAAQNASQQQSAQAQAAMSASLSLQAEAEQRLRHAAWGCNRSPLPPPVPLVHPLPCCASLATPP